MKKPLFTAFFLIFVLLLMSCSKSVAPGNSSSNLIESNNYQTIEWAGTDLIYSSESGGKELSLLYFTDDSCADGLLMDFYTFVDSAVILTLNHSYNVARISTSDDSLIQFYDSTMTGNELFKLYNLVGVPSFLILDKENKYFGRLQADYYPADQFLGLLQLYIKKNQE